MAGVFILVCLSGLLASARVAADDGATPPQLAPGVRVRILAPDVAEAAVIGTVGTLDERTISIDIAGRAERLIVRREQIVRLEVSAGRGSRVVGGLLGAAAGGLAGGWVALRSDFEETYQHPPRQDLVVGAAVGALLGAVLGVALPPGERWRELSASNSRFSVAPRFDRGICVSFSMGF